MNLTAHIHQHRYLLYIIVRRKSAYVWGNHPFLYVEPLNGPDGIVSGVVVEVDSGVLAGGRERPSVGKYWGHGDWPAVALAAQGGRTVFAWESAVGWWSIRAALVRMSDEAQHADTGEDCVYHCGVLTGWKLGIHWWLREVGWVSPV